MWNPNHYSIGNCWVCFQHRFNFFGVNFFAASINTAGTTPKYSDRAISFQPSCITSKRVIDTINTEKVAAGFFDILQNHLAPICAVRGLAISFELKELEPVLKYNKNNIEDHL